MSTVNGFITPEYKITFPAGSGSVGAENVFISVIGAPKLIFPAISGIKPGSLNQKITVTNIDANSNPSFQPDGYDTFANAGSGVLLSGVSGLGNVVQFQPVASKINPQGGGVWQVIESNNAK